MKVIKRIFLSAAFIFLFSSSTVFAQVENVVPVPTQVAFPVNSFELFWPVSPGRVMGDKLYSLKLFKESLREVFIFNDLKKAEYNITLSEKRTVEAEKLFLENKDTINGENTLSEAQKKRETALNLVMESRSKNTSDVKSRMINSFKNQKLLLESIATKVSEDQKSAFAENIKEINTILDRIN